MNRIVPIVEGKGEIEAVPKLLYRMISQSGVADSIYVHHEPYRIPRSQLIKEDCIRKYVNLARREKDCAAILILFDSDDDCPKEMAVEIEAWAKHEAIDIPVSVVMANREYEAWFLASMESLHAIDGVEMNAESHPTPKIPRDAKKQLSNRMTRNYKPTIDQKTFTQKFDMKATYIKCRSFRKMVKAFTFFMQKLGAETTNWPPADWIAGDE